MTAIAAKLEQVRQHVQSVDLSALQKHVDTVTAASDLTTATSSICSIWQTAKPFVSIVEGMPNIFVPAKEKALVQELATALDRLCTAAALPAAPNMQAIFTEVCQAWQGVKLIVVALVSLPWVPPQAAPIISALETAANTICASLTPGPQSSAA